VTLIAFISPCGFGNLGDVAIQDAFIDGVRTQLGSATTIVGITQNPDDTARRHHVPAVPMDADSFRLRRPQASPDHVAQDPRPAPGAAGPLSRLVGSAKLLVREIIHWRIAFREMRRVDTLVVSGGGQLDDHWGGAWRVPYALWKWSLVARLLRKDVVFLSVGAGTIDSSLTRRFLRSALGRARYVSFRDEETAARVRTRRLSTSTLVVPDLAFGYDVPSEAASTLVRVSGPTVVVSPIAFLDPATWPRKDDAAYGDQLNRTIELTRLLLERGLRVIVCTSDKPDLKPATTLYDALAAEHHSGTLEFSLTSGPVDLLEAFGRADIAIASRLHGLILANIAGTPTIALSYDWKVDVHMRMVGLEDFVHPIESFEPSHVLASVDTLFSNREEVVAALSARCELLSQAVRAQFVDVFGRYASGDHAQHEHRIAVAHSAE
jgi:polysaccharide pyruvyl transferase WcaK-like protein